MLTDSDKKLQALEGLPITLPATYKRVLNRIAKPVLGWDVNINGLPPRWKLARQILLWVLYSKPPLRLSELAVAVAINPKDNKLNKVNRDEELLRICGPLIKISNASRVVEPRHFSVAQYITVQLGGLSVEERIPETVESAARLRLFSIRPLKRGRFRSL